MPRSMKAPNAVWSTQIAYLHQLSRLDDSTRQPVGDTGQEEADSSSSGESDEWETDSGAEVDDQQASEPASETQAVGNQQTEHDAAAAAEPAAAEAQCSAPAQNGSVGGVCKLLWAAAICGRCQEDFDASRTLPADTRYLIHLAGYEQLLLHLATAAVRALDSMCRTAQLPAASRAASAAVAAADAGRQGEVAAASTGSYTGYSGSTQPAAEAVHPRLTKETLLPVLQLLLAFAACARTYNIYANTMTDYFAQFATKMMLQTAVDLSGLGRVFAALCNDLAAALRHQQQQQEQSPDDECQLCTRLLASACLHVIRFCILSDRPAQILWDSVIGPMIQPAVTLAAVLQQAYDAAPLATATPPARTDAAAALASTTDADVPATDSSVAFDEWLTMWQDDSAVGQEPMAISDHIAYGVLQGYFNYKGADPVLVKLLASQDMQQLMLVSAAARAQHLWNLAGGRSKVARSSRASPQQHQQQEEGEGVLDAPDVPSWHSQMYVACGLKADADLTAVFKLWDDSDPNPSVTSILALMSQLSMSDFWKQHNSGIQTMGALLQTQEDLHRYLNQRQHGRRRQQRQHGRRRQQQQQDEPLKFLADPELRIAVLLVLLETLLLCPSMKFGAVTLKAISQLSIKGWCFNPPATTSPAAPDLHHPSGDCPEGVLVPPVLLKLYPTYTYILDNHEPETQTDASQHEFKALNGCYAATVALVMCADTWSGSKGLSRALDADPAATYKALETAVRVGAQSYGQLLTLDTQLMTASLKQIFSRKDLPPAATAAAPSAPIADRLAASIATPATVVTPAAGSLELFSLLLSSLKFTVGYVTKGPAPGFAGEGLVDLMMVIVNTLGLVLGVPGIEGNQGTAGSAGPSAEASVLSHRWLVLAARALMHYSKLRGELATSAGWRNFTQNMQGLTQGMIAAVRHTISSTLSFLETGLPASAGPVVNDELYQQIMEMLTQLQGQLGAQQDQAPGAETSTSQQSATDMQRLLPADADSLLANLGEGVCALLPSPYCCNNPGCTSLSEAGEVTAVKAGRCSGCKVAHYCCARCQKDHWSRHKSVCKRLKADSTTAQACKDKA